MNVSVSMLNGNPIKGNGESKVPSWPHLVLREGIAALAVLALLLSASILLHAPLGLPGSAGISSAEAKAPWYLVGLQELLVYFEPWLAGAVIPLLIVLGLLALPFVDSRSISPGRRLRDRWFAVTFYAIGFSLWCGLIVVGMLFRGPGWTFCLPGRLCEPPSILDEGSLSGAIGISSDLAFGIVLMLCVMGAVGGTFLLARRLTTQGVPRPLLKGGAAAIFVVTLLAVLLKISLHLLLGVRSIF
jgi:quinol-cytochrome oxidoreductase complex cytochrome b subunit